MGGKGDPLSRKRGVECKDDLKEKSSIQGSVSIKNIIVLFIVFSMILALFQVSIMNFIDGHVGLSGIHPRTAEYSIERSIDIRNRGSSSMDYNLTLATPSNISENDIQYIENIDFNLEPEFYERYGTEWMSWNSGLEPNREDSVRVSYDVKTSSVDWDYSGPDSGTIEDIPEELIERYNRNQWPLDEDRNDDGTDDWMIEPENPKIETLAEEIVEGEDNIYDKSRAINRWIDENIEYELGDPGLPKHAVWVLESRAGDCDEQSFLYASLSRAVGIPAWMELGALYNRRENRWGKHAWIRTIFVDHEGITEWVNIDPANDQFYFRDALRFTTWVDEGGEDHLEDYYYYLYWRGGLIDLESNFESLDMKTQGTMIGIASQSSGYELNVGVPVVITSILIYSVVKKGKEVA